MRHLFLGLVLVTGIASASDVVVCHDYCAGRDLYTQGYKMCGGGECWCDYTVIHESPRCPEKPRKGDFPFMPVAQADAGTEIVLQ